MRSRWSLISSWKSCNNLQTHLVKILQHQNNQYIKENLVGGCSGSFHMKAQLKIQGNRKSLEFLKTSKQADPRWSLEPRKTYINVHLSCLDSSCSLYTAVSSLLHFALSSFTGVTFFTRGREGLPPARRLPLTLLWHSPYCGGLDSNLRHLFSDICLHSSKQMQVLKDPADNAPR